MSYLRLSRLLGRERSEDFILTCSRGLLQSLSCDCSVLSVCKQKIMGKSLQKENREASGEKAKACFYNRPLSTNPLP